jgi:hypothetical protein
MRCDFQLLGSAGDTTYGLRGVIDEEKGGKSYTSSVLQTMEVVTSRTVAMQERWNGCQQMTINQTLAVGRLTMLCRMRIAEVKSLN